ncbi:MAG: hypothetical protein EZS28_027380 [Streblomastix strix]|uniref:Uncharacterized protein n=1 Tax=Streblomastix strix TaxID=222440 RepID=A0A5J4V3N2_9EUKA|nr:MAG: hypothetical protein EZS28_027380 [Streblomastix strix]
MELTQDIGQLQDDVQDINTELARQTHFRGYFTTNDEILALTGVSKGDQAYSAKDLLVWIYDTSLYETDQIVPDQVTPASDSLPQESIVTGYAGINTEYSRSNHKHSLQVSSLLPAKDTATCEEGTANSYARSDHTLHLNLNNGVPLKDTGTGTAGISNIYSCDTHQHSLNIDPTSTNVSLINVTAAANGISDYYCINIHVNPQQLTYDENITATKFIKTGGTDNEILLGDGTTKNISFCKQIISSY